MNTERNMKWYIERIKERHNIPSNNKLADRMEFARPTISMFYQGKNWPSEANMIEFGQLAGISPAVALMDLRTMKSTGKVKSVYMEITDQLTKALAIILASSALIMVNTTPSEAATLSTAKTDCIYYGKLRLFINKLIFTFYQWFSSTVKFTGKMCKITG